MKKCICSGFLLILCSISAPAASAFNWEIHPGITSSIEYTDNYFGVPFSANPQSDTIYYVGPTLDFNISKQNAELNFSGYYTKDYHKRNTRDDSENILAETRLDLRGQKQLFNVEYSYSRTMERQTLDQAWGEYSYHTGSAEYRRNFSERDSATLRYNRRQEYAPDDPLDNTSNNLVSNSSEMILEIAPTQKNTLTLTARGDDYKYSSIRRDNIVTATGDAVWMYSLSSRLRGGLEMSFTSNSPSRNANSEIYEAFVRGEYQISENIRILARAGHSWLRQEIEGITGIASGELSIERQTDSDRVSLSASRDFSYDYTTGSTYGLYQITSGTASWSHTFIRGLSMDLEGSVVKRKPESSQQLGTSDYNYSLALRYSPFEWITIDGSYSYLVTMYKDIPASYPGNTDTRRENRCRFSIGVRY